MVRSLDVVIILNLFLIMIPVRNFQRMLIRIQIIVAEIANIHFDKKEIFSIFIFKSVKLNYERNS
jgi:hypothetical protein